MAIGHFNVADLVLLKAIFGAAQELNAPVVVSASEGEREFMGVRQIALLVRSLRDEFDLPIFLNVDHTHSLAKAVEATKAGFDSVIFDRSALPFEENVRQTKEAVQALKAINPVILIEGEVGDIGTGSEIHEVAPDLSNALTNAFKYAHAGRFQARINFNKKELRLELEDDGEGITTTDSP